MTPLRLLIVALLAYVGWRLLRGRRSARRGDATVPNDEGEPQDVLVEDPVCHVLVPKHQALRLRKGETTYYFCSEQCCDRFVSNTERQGEA